ncbi:high mobility group protein HMGI-C-like [Varroa jacobsoni]|uniref:Uncharacterized protein n=1 Tax=Varroa destructor TaxID=109461 RepID=A0A7M7K321_VARDE|nr:high mobility group protein HMGI-C-like [Varroa destructor]XP_022660089.1 high mobility group protein HMGI-C-like [Varroa destructor]XP_022700346.1 high mobility group protein HMGI-C-like [Varroa jacobsoni]
MSDSEVQEKKARGRPRKSEADKTTSPAAKKPKVDDGPKRGRGRPKGSVNKKKKGSIKKGAAGGKKRGRKPKAAKPPPQAEEEEEAAEDGDE